MTSPARWPTELLLVRHAESAGNVARDKAEAAGLDVIDIAERDMDVTLSSRGEDQAAALGQWIGSHESATPDGVVSLAVPARPSRLPRSRFVPRGLDLPVVLDERAREGVRNARPAHSSRHRRSGFRTKRKPGNGSASSTTGRRAVRAGATSRYAFAAPSTASRVNTQGNASWSSHMRS